MLYLFRWAYGLIILHIITVICFFLQVNDVKVNDAAYQKHPNV